MADPGTVSRVGRPLMLIKIVALKSASALVIMALLQGCMVTGYLKNQKGTSIDSVKPTTMRSDVEAALGPPLRTWTTTQGVHYAQYRYLADTTKPDYADATGWAILDVISLGAAEVFWFVPETREHTDRRRAALMAVAYDETNHVIGVFPDVTELTKLPEDGRSAVSKTEGSK